MIISFINFKGGVGKTTTAYHIGCALAKKNLKILLVDMDPQCSLTLQCISFENLENKVDMTLQSLFNAHLDGQSFSEDIIWKSPIRKPERRKFIQIYPTLDVLPCYLDLMDIEERLFTNLTSNRDIRVTNTENLILRSILKTYLDPKSSDYDYILIDCPPNLGILTQNALYASNFFFATAIPDYLSSTGLSLLNRKVEEKRRQIQGWSESTGCTFSFSILRGIIFVRVKLYKGKPIENHARQIDKIKNQFPEHVFQNYTTEHGSYSEAASKSLPIFETGANRKIKSQYIKIAEELLEKIKNNF